MALLCLFAILPISVKAQAPVAQFAANKTAGCSPVVVQFTDQSTGNPTSWSWDLGNGGSSTLQNPAATYITPGSYRIILTATNANGSSKDTTFITVHTSPTVNFMSDTVTACGSKTVQFNNLTTPGETGVTSYLWDFGDGDSSTAVSPSHTYTYSGNFAVSLVVTNSKGCTNSITKSSYIKVIGKPTGAFTANQTSSCNAPFQVAFVNTTTNATGYAWDFGDGGTSTATAPSHTYTTPGTYTVRLISTGSNGCKDTLTKTSYISIGQVAASFTNTVACEGGLTVFTNTTTPGLGTSRTWSFGTGATDTAANPSFSYLMPGNYTVTLIEKYANNCNDTFSKTITVLPKPDAGFTTGDTVACTVPFSASFTNTSTGAASYAWAFNPGTSAATNPSHSFTTMGLYNVTLVATSAGGCKDTFTKTNAVKIQEPVATLSASPTSACTNRTINFSGAIATPLFATNYRWDFGDGSAIVNCATCKTQSHAYSATGTYIVQLIVTTTSGCFDTVTRTITINEKPTANFSGTPTTVCPDQTLWFTNSSIGALSYIWAFGDGQTTTTASPGHSYNNPGTYDVTLIAANGGCRDTIKKTAYITVQLPMASFKDSFSCGNKLTHYFIDSSVGANTYSWDFGDGNTSTTTGSVSHTYASAGIYNVVLRVVNTASGCEDTIARVINTNSIPLPTYSVNDSAFCVGETFGLTRSSGSSAYKYAVHFGNSVLNNQSTYLFWHTSLPGIYDVKIVVSDSFGCKDSIYRPNFIKVGKTSANFTVSSQTPCKGTSVLFDENSVEGPFPVVTRIWSFGDGVQETRASDTIWHKYNNTGPYNVKLVVIDANGCRDSITKNNNVYVYKPVAQFYTNDTIICAGDTVQFINNSGGADFTSAWSFGDGGTSTITTPQHIYNAFGQYTVKLVLTDKYGCKDSATKNNYIKVERPAAAFSLSDTLGACPPLTVYTTNNTTGTNTYNWSFGNNNQSSNINPSITYTYPGTYTVRLIAINEGGCKDTATKTVKVNGPTGTYTYSPKGGCNPLTVQFSASSSNTSVYIWDMNNGVTQNTSTGSFSYTYTQTGQYVPKLILSDGASCQVPLQNMDTVTVDQLDADFSFLAAGDLCSTDTVYFNDTLFESYSDIVSRSWAFGDGGSSTSEDPAHYYSSPGTYQVRLIVGNVNGCKDTTNATITVNTPPVLNVSNNTSVCLGSGTALQVTGASTYTWSPTTGLSCTNCANPTATPTVTTTYTVIGENGTGCKDTATVTVTVNNQPVVIAGTDKEVCAGSSVVLQATGASTYTWTPATGLSCTNCVSPTATPTATTVYTVTGVDGNGCSDTGVVTVKVNPLPTVDAGTDKSICPGDSAQLTATGATSYNWTPTNGLSCAGCTTPKASPSATTIYTVTGTDAKGCQNTATVKVNLNTTPVVSAGNSKTICIGDTVTLQATGAAAYTWSPATGLSCTNCASPNTSPANTTVYTVIGANGSSCKDTATVTVTVNPLPVVSAGADKSVCAGIGVAIQATGAASYTWTPTTGLSCVNCATPTATPSATTVYTVTGTDANGCIDTAAVKVNVNPLPNVSAGSNQTVCLGDSAQLQATGAVVYSWSPGTGLNCTNCASPKAAPSATTVYTVTGTDANGCQKTSTVTVNVNASPTISATNQTICSGSSVQLQAAGAVSYSWTPATGLSCTNCPNPTANPTTTTVYTITGTDANGCKGDGTVTVSINALPTVSAGNNVDICSADSAQLQASGAATYSWSPATGLNCTNCANPKASPAVTTIYTVTGTDANGCVNTSTVTVTVKQLPNVSAGNDAAICLGKSVTLNATGATNYTWSPATGLSCTNCSSPLASPTVTTTYITKGIAVNGCSAQDTVVVTVNPLPTVSAGANTAICENDSLKLNATGAANYTWSPAAGLSCTTCPDPFAKPATTTTFTLIGTDANGCKDTAQVTITIKPIPVVSVSAARTTLCSGDTTQLVANGATGGYTWSPTTGLSCVGCASPIATPANTTAYIVTGMENGCTDTAHITVNTLAKPNVSAGNDTAYCIGGSGKLHATGATSYTWSPATGLSCTGCASPSVSVGATTIYTVTGIDNNGCVNTDDVLVTINSLPNVNAGDDREVCEGDSIRLQAQGASSYVWSPANGLSCVTCPDPKATTKSKTTFTVTGTDINGCVNTDDITITQLDKKPVAFSPDDSICVGESVELFAEGGTEYLWSPTDGISYNNGKYTVAPFATTQYTVIVKQGICFADTGKITVRVFALPEIDAGDDFDLGNSSEVKIYTRSSGVAKYEWSPVSSLSCSDCANPTAIPLQTTTYRVKVASDFGCEAEDDVTIRVTCGVNQLFIANTFTPNNDGVNDVFFPQGKGVKTLTRFSVYSRWGELLFDVKDMPLNDPTYGWNGTYKSEPLKPDVFVYIIRAVCEDGRPVELKGDISLVR